MQWTIGALSINNPTAKSTIIPFFISTDDEIGQFKGIFKSVKTTTLSAMKLYIFSSLYKNIFQNLYLELYITIIYKECNLLFHNCLCLTTYKYAYKCKYLSFQHILKIGIISYAIEFLNASHFTEI
jgi:hypothetical protein